MVAMATLPPAKELKIQVVSWQNEIRTLDVLKSPTWIISNKSIDFDLITNIIVIIATNRKSQVFRVDPSFG